MIYTSIHMKQFNLKITPELDLNLRRFMKGRNIPTKVEAIRQALREGVARMEAEGKGFDFRSMLGLGLQAPQSDSRKFKSEDDLWS